METQKLRLSQEINELAYKARTIEKLTADELARRIHVGVHFLYRMKIQLKTMRIQTLMKYRDRLKQYIENPKLQFPSKNELVGLQRIDFSEKIINYSTAEMIEEMKRRGDWKEIEISTDKELADELRRRGYDVTAKKTTTTEL